MIRTIKRAAVLAAIPAAVAIGISAPANADSVGTLAMAGNAYSQPQLMGSAESLSTGQSCTALATRALSGESTSTSTITFYRDTSCLVPIGVATPTAPALVLPGGATAYSST